MRAARDTGRRGLGSIAGTAMFMSILFGVMGMLYMFTEYQRTILEVLKTEGSVAVEEFSILTSVHMCNGSSQCLTIGVRNEGSKSITLVSLWIVDKYGAVIRHDDLNMVLPPSREVKQIISNIVIPDGSYEVKVVSSKGTVKIEDVQVPYTPLVIKTITINSILCMNSRVIIHVTNLDDSTLDDVRVYLGSPGRTINLGRMEVMQSTVAQWDTVSRGGFTVYAEGRDVLGILVRSNYENVTLTCT